MRVYQVACGVVFLALISVAMVAPGQGAASSPGVVDCPADIVDNGMIDAADLAEVVMSLGPCTDCPADLTGDGVVDAADVLEVLAGLGGCASTGERIAVGGGHVCAVNDDSFTTANGGCQDLATGLVWSTNGMGHGVNYNWNSSKDLIAASTEGGVDNWRMPTLAEWLEAIDNGAASHFGGGHTVSSPTRYWSSTTQGNKAWAVDFFGFTVKHPKYDYMYFAGVREIVAPDPCNNNGICESGEDCDNCGDCEGKSNGPPSRRFCCGNGVDEPAEGNGAICDGNQ